MGFFIAIIRPANKGIILMIARWVGMGDKYSQIIVNRILSLCKSRNITIYQLGKMGGISHSTLDNIINRKTFNPKMKTLHKIATAFGMTLAELLDFEELNDYSFDDQDDEI